MSTATGRAAEARASTYLGNHGFIVKAHNWRTRYCEIDLIALKNRTVYFVEVKYRRTSHQGRGLDYITPAKLKRMQFAAELWVHRYQWTGPYELAAIEVSGPDYTVSGFINVLT